MKKYIAVVEPISTGKNYIFEIAKRGYIPIAVFPWNDTDEKVREEYEVSHRRPCINLFPKETIVIYGSEKYEELILELKKYPIECVVAGSEQGVITCDRIAEDLKIAGNPVSRSKSHIDKNEMQNALKDYGIRYIKGMLVHSVDETKKFLADEHIEKSVVKHVDGAGSVGLHICSTVEECLEAVQQELGNSVMYSHNTESVLVQEFIEGTEYVVNTMSSNGDHCITDIWKYNKVKMGSAGNPYENCELITELKPEHVGMCQYAYEVVEALGIKYGPTHGEYMMMPSGEVVLIEAGARPMGANMPQKFLDEILGHHIVDISLDTYLDYERFLAFKEKPYRPIKSGMMVFLITPNDMQISDMPIFNIFKNLKSLYRVNIDGVLASENLKKTVDLETASGVLYLFHEDEAQVKKDYELIRELEWKYFELLFGKKNESEEGGTYDETSIFMIEGNTLRINIEQKLINMEDFLQMLSDIIEKNRITKVIVPKESYENIPYKASGAAVMLQINGMKLEVPSFETRDMVIGTREI